MKVVDENPQNLLSDLLLDSNGSLHIRNSNHSTDDKTLFEEEEVGDYNDHGDQEDVNSNSSNVNINITTIIHTDVNVDVQVRNDEEGNEEAESSNNKRKNKNNQGNDNIDNNNSNEIVLFAGCKSLLQLLEHPPMSNASTGHDKDDSTTEKETTTNVNNDHKNEDNQKTSVEDLVYVSNLYDPIMKAIREVLKMREAKPSRKEREKSKDDEANHTNNNNDNDDADDENHHKEEEGDEDINHHDNEGEDGKWIPVNDSSKNLSHNDQLKKSASYLTQVTFNTFNVLIPILLKLITHPDRCNYDLRMKGPRIRKKDEATEIKLPDNIMENAKKRNARSHARKTQCYLIFDKVYSISSLKAFEGLMREVDLLLSLVSPKPKLDDDYLNNNCMNNDPTRLVWGTCRTSDEIIKKTFVSRTSVNCKGKKSESDSDNDNPLDNEIEKFCNKVDTELIQPLVTYSNEIVTAQKIMVERLYDEIHRVLSRRFPNLQLTVYGSCLSGLALGTSSDVDLSLSLVEIDELKNGLRKSRIGFKNYEREMKNYVYKVTRALCQLGNGAFVDVMPIPYARVPVVKGTCYLQQTISHLDASMNFDICFHNDIAVMNSTLLREYSLIDPRVKTIMLCIKSWIKWKRVGNAADHTLSSYSWMILVIFYLQCLDFLPNLQCPVFMEEHGFYYDENSRLHNIDDLRTHFLTSTHVKQVGKWKVPEKFGETPVSVLLAGFFFFYARHFPKHITAVSIRLGKCVLQKSVFKSCRFWRLCIEDPFETHDSHFPHDLGTPMNEGGQSRVTKALTETADMIETMFSDCSSVTDFIGSLCHLSDNSEVRDIQHHNNDVDNQQSRREIYGRIKAGDYQRDNGKQGRNKRSSKKPDKIRNNDPQQENQQQENRQPRSKRRDNVSQQVKHQHENDHKGKEARNKQSGNPDAGPQDENQQQENKTPKSRSRKKNKVAKEAKENDNNVQKTKNPQNKNDTENNDTTNHNESTNNGEVKKSSKQKKREKYFKQLKENRKKKAQESYEAKHANVASHQENKSSVKIDEYS